MNIDNIWGVVLQVSCIFIFLTVFFFTYTANEEKKVVENQVNFLIDNIVGSNINLLPNSVKQSILDKCDKLKSDNSQNESIKANNDSIKSKSIIIMIVLISIVTVITVWLKYNNYIHLEKLLKETGLIVLFVAITEFLFLTFFASRWISVDPSLIKAHLFNNLAEAFSQSSSSS